MASIFSHALTGIAFSNIYADKKLLRKVTLLAIFCTILPDADVLAFKFGIPYEHLFGHRGFTHSILFALLLAIGIKALFFAHMRFASLRSTKIITFFFFCAISHGLLDAATNGGLGVAFFAPFDNARYFLPWRPIQVSPIGVSNFFSHWGLAVIKSELIWVAIPSVLLFLLSTIIKKTK